MKGFADISGPNYEIKMSALLFLRAIQTREKFQIASNMKAAGKFDDVLLQLGDNAYFLQLKHKHHSEIVLKLRHLVHDKDFKLQKYLESLKEIKMRWQTDEDLKKFGKFEDAKFVIFTNVGVNESLVSDADAADLRIVSTGGKSVCFTELFSSLPTYKARLSAAVSSGNIPDSPEMWEIVHKLYNKETRDLPSKEHLKEILDQITSLEDLVPYQQLYKQLFLCTEQSTETDLDDLIKQEIHSLKLFDQLMKAITDWWRTSSEYLTGDWNVWRDMFHSCADSITQPNPPIDVKFQQEHCVAIIEKLACTNRKLLIRSNCTSLSLVKVLQTFVNNTLLVDVSTLCERVGELVAVWRLGKCDVLVVNGCTTDVTALGHKLTTLPGTKCLVVISDSQQAECQFVTVNDINCFTQLESDSQRKILQREVYFQGYLVNLNSLADVSFLQKYLFLECLLKLHYTLQVGEKLQELDPCYVQRTFIRNDVVSKQIFREESINLAVTGVHRDRLAELIPSGEKVMLFNKHNLVANRDCRYWLVEGETDFAALCTVKDNIHLIETCEQGFRWIQSKRSVSHIRKHFKQQSTRNAESVVGLHQKMVLVVAEPGMGKSTEMANIAHVVKQKDPATWVLRVNLNECATLFTHLVTAVESLQQVANLKTEFEKHLLEYQLLFDGNVVVLVDGFDEISPNYSNQIFQLLKNFSELKIKKIFIASRPVCKKELEQKLSSLAFSFRGFDSEDQEDFLVRYWNVNSCQLSEFVTTLLKLIKSNLNENLDEFVGTPLHCRMLAEVFHDDANHFCRTGEVRLPPSLDVLMLYDQFFDKKFQVYCGKMNVDVNTAVLLYLINKQKHQLLQSHMNCAMIAYFDYKCIESLHSSMKIKAGNKEFIDQFRRGEDKIGIVTQIMGENAVFVHRTFAEYFVAMWFSKHFQTESNLIKQIYFNRNFEVVQKFLDRILAKGHELHTAVINAEIQRVQNLIMEQSTDVNERDIGGRTALHLGIINFKIFNNSNEASKRYNKNVINNAIVDTLLEHGAEMNGCEDKVLHYTPLRLAEETKVWSLVNKFLGKHADDTDLIWIRKNIKKRVACMQHFVQSIVLIFKCCVNCECKNGICVEYCMSESLQDVMYTALQEGHVNLVKFILKCGVSVEHEVHAIMQPKSTMVRIATENGQLETVQLLIEWGSDVNISDDGNVTPLMRAVICGYVQVAELLVKHGASANAKDLHDCTALQWAARMRRHEMVDFLLPVTSHKVSDIDSVICAAACGDMEAALILTQNKFVNSQDKNGNTALLLAAGLGKHEIVEFLLQHGAEVDKSNEYNRTPLVWACLSGHVEVAELLVKHGASINARDVGGSTALLLAAGWDRYEMVQMLLQHGADVDDCGMHNRTPLMKAAARGQVQAAELLLKHGASVNAMDTHGLTALRYARMYKCDNVVKLLEEYGAVELTHL